MGWTIRALAGRAAAVALLLVGSPAAAGGGAAPPWEVWDDLHRLAELPAGDQVLLRGSHCPSGCQFDRHSAGDWRYIRLDGDEGVIFEEAGAGAITRIWMTMGQGVSQPLVPSVRLRVYLDGAASPVVDLPLPALFDGSMAPFLAPLVADRMVSSGGNVSYVPIPYRAGCRVTLTGAHEEKIWYQLTFHRLAEPAAVVSFTGREDLSAWAALLAARGEDPWLLGPGPPGVTESGKLALAPGETASLAALAGPDALTALRLRLAESSWRDIELRLGFDGHPRVRMPLADFFAAGRTGGEPTRSLLIGATADGTLYAYFPMPFFTAAEVELENRAPAGSPPIPLTWEIRRADAAPAPGSGWFGAQLRVDGETAIGVDIPLLELDGEGRWVGLFAELGSVGTPQRQYLEGDERLFLDRSPHPALYGTGTEDFFSGGFYFDQGPFQLALHGSPYHLTGGGEDVTAAYRLMLTDAVSFTHRIRAGLEGGPESDLALRVRTVAYYYQRPTPGLWPWDVLDLGDAASRARHSYMVDGTHELLPLTALFEGEPPQAATATGVYRPPGTAHFRLRVAEDAGRLRLRRRLDAGVAGQQAEVYAGGSLVGRFPPVDENPHRRWREFDLDLPAAAVPPGGGELSVSVVAVPDPRAPQPPSTFTAFRYELWSDADPALFADGFESGDLSRWAPPGRALSE